MKRLEEEAKFTLKMNKGQSAENKDPVVKAKHFISSSINPEKQSNQRSYPPASYQGSPSRKK